MKLLHCDNCQDIFSMTFLLKSCSCGKTSGVYIDALNAVYTGKYAVCLGIDNQALDIAISKQSVDGEGVKFESYVVPSWCSSTIKVDTLELDKKSLFSLFINSEDYLTTWSNEVEKKRNGIRRIIYLIGKRLMQIEIKSLDKKHPRMEYGWYSNFTERVLELADRIVKCSNVSPSQAFYLLCKLIKFDTSYLSFLQSKDDEELKELMETVLHLAK